MRTLAKTFLLAAGLWLAAPVAADGPALPTLGDWILLDRVDPPLRSPFRPDAVWATYMLDEDAPSPAAGAVVKAPGGFEAAWRTLPATDEDGAQGVGRPLWAYTTVEAETDGVWLLALSRVAAVILDGRPIYGDIYGYGHTRVPVRIPAGSSRLFAVGLRWPITVELTRPEGPVLVEAVDATLPELVPGETVAPHAAVLLTNATDRVQTDLVVSASLPALGTAFVQTGLTLPPLSQQKVALLFDARDVPTGIETPTLSVKVSRGYETLADRTFALTVRRPGEARRRTFVSAIDGSVQFYAELPPAAALEPDATTPRTPGLVLTLHGASVDAHNQARAYGPKPGLWIVAPTNRRPFGFDWQDWGRMDAYEVLEDALARTQVDPTRVWLTGHSMGGHGTWHLAVNDPDRFGAIAPSAAWVSFDTYGRSGRPAGPLARIWEASDLASDTLGLKENLARLPIRQLHGGADDNVPPSEATRMKEALDGVAEDYALEIVEGKGHWWDGDAAPGADCVDWPPFFETFQESPVPIAPEEIRFTSAGPEVDATHFWVTLQQPLEIGRRLRIEAARVEDRIEATTTNVRRLVFHPPWRVSTVVLDGFRLTVPPGTARFAFVKDGLAWKAAPPAVPADERSPERSGPFKRLFDNRFVLVYGTAGDDAEDRRGLARARYDAERWRYRANGRAVVVPDTELLGHPATYAGRNVVLYGNAATNRAWSAVLPARCPIRLVDGKAIVGAKQYEGDDLAAYFVYPRKGDAHALAGAVAWTGSRGERLTILSGYLASGAGYPDYVVFGPKVLETGDYGVKAAGMFDITWSLVP